MEDRRQEEGREKGRSEGRKQGRREAREGGGMEGEKGGRRQEKKRRWVAACENVRAAQKYHCTETELFYFPGLTLRPVRENN